MNLMIDVINFAAMEAGTSSANAIRTVMFSIDTAVYSLLGWLYELFLWIASARYTDIDVINLIMQRFGLLVGIYMVFSLSFTLIKKLVDPDSGDKNGGVGNIVVRILVSIIALASVNLVFDYVYRLQEMLIQQDVIGKIFLTGTNVSIKTEDNTKRGRQLAINTFSTFYTKENETLLKNYTGSCWNEDTVYSVPWLEVQYVDDPNVSFSSLSNCLNETTGQASDKIYVVNYSMFLSTIAGLLMCWMFILYSYDLGLRAAKLAFLQVIAPIPILSYIVPKNTSFQKWLKDVAVTFLELFLRIAAVYIAMVLISMFGPDTLSFANNSSPTGIILPLVYVILVFGILSFAKKAPQMIKDLFGLKGDADYSLGLKDRGYLGNTLSVFGGSALGAAMGAYGGVKAGIASGSGREALLGGVTGLFSGAGRGVANGISGKKMSDLYKKQSAANVRNMQYALQGNTTSDRIGAWWSNVSGEANRMDAQVNAYDDYLTTQKKVTDALDSMVTGGKFEGESYGEAVIRNLTDSNGNVFNSKMYSYNDLSSKISSAKSSGQETVSFVDGNNVTHEINIASAENALESLKSSIREKAYVALGSNRREAEKYSKGVDLYNEVQNLTQKAHRVEQVDNSLHLSGSTLSSGKKAVDNAKSGLTNSAAYKRVKSARANSGKK